MHQVVGIKTYDEEYMADMLRALYRLGCIDFIALDAMVDELSVRLLKL